MPMFKKHLKDYFIPHEENKYAPHGLQKASMVGMLFLVVLSFTATNALSLLWISSNWMVSTVLPSVIVDLTNDERGEDALLSLKRNALLDEAARLKAQDMTENEYFAHHSPQGISPWYWFGQVAYNFVYAGENLAIHFTDSGDVVEAWMDSPAHRANILNGNYTEIGVGTAEGSYEGHETVYVVQLFGTPAAAVAQSAAPAAPVQVAQGDEEEEEQTEAVLSESVTITEKVVMVPAEPEPILVEEEAPQNTQETPEQNVVQNTTIMDMDVTNGGVIMYSDFISTSTGGIAALAEPTETQKFDTAPFYMELATQPHKLLQISYVLIGLFVLCSLLLSIFIEIRKQQPRQIAYSVGLMAVMVCLFYIHTILSTGAFIA